MTKDQEFKQEFFALLRKYNAGVYTREKLLFDDGGISFNFIDDTTMDLDLGRYEDGKEFV